jgi:predicted MPP superfamily phosphohydrolase
MQAVWHCRPAGGWEDGRVPSSALPTALLAAGAGGLAWSLAEARAFTVRRFTLAVLPDGSPPLRVLHLSDLHLVPRQGAKRAWVQGLAALEPDLVVSTGDSLAHANAVAPVLEAHGGLLDRPGVFVLGSNDYFAPRLKNPARYLTRGGGRRVVGTHLPTADLVRGFTARGWLDLTNRRRHLVVDGRRLEFVGVDDPHLRYDRYERVAGASDPAAVLTVGVTHAPYRRVLDAMTSDGAGLVLAGHTHGGQLALPWFGALVTNCDLDRRRAKGVSRWTDGRGSNAWLHVSAGLGTNPFTPVRFACRPEASLLTLVAKSAKG